MRQFTPLYRITSQRRICLVTERRASRCGTRRVKQRKARSRHDIDHDSSVVDGGNRQPCGCTAGALSWHLRSELTCTLGGAFPVFLRSLSGKGHATHLGRFTTTVEWQLNVLTDPVGGVGLFTLTAANGDTLFGTITGLATVVDGIAYIQETHTITGGTGRFAGATGTFVGGRVLVEATGMYASSFDGTIDLHH